MEKLRILTVEDEIDVCDGLFNYFRRRSYHIEVATRGDKALEMLLANTFDVCLLDLNLPGLSGQDIIKRSSEASLKTVFFIVTGYLLDEDRQKFFSPQVKGYFNKPLHIEEIHTAIQKQFCLSDSPVLNNEYQRLDLSQHVEKPIKEMIHDLANELNTLRVMTNNARCDFQDGFWQNLNKADLERLFDALLESTLKHLNRAENEVSLLRLVTRKP